MLGARALTNCQLWEIPTSALARIAKHRPHIVVEMCTAYLEHLERSRDKYEESGKLHLMPKRMPSVKKKLQELLQRARQHATAGTQLRAGPEAAPLASSSFDGHTVGGDNDDRNRRELYGNGEQSGRLDGVNAPRGDDASAYPSTSMELAGSDVADFVRTHDGMLMHGAGGDGDKSEEGKGPTAHGLLPRGQGAPRGAEGDGEIELVDQSGVSFDDEAEADDQELRGTSVASGSPSQQSRVLKQNDPSVDLERGT
jgi:hypothetical protein